MGFFFRYLFSVSYFRFEIDSVLRNPLTPKFPLDPLKVITSGLPDFTDSS